MAGERIGKAYEALLYVVFNSFHKEKIVEGNVYWNEIPEGISVEPDFVIGPDKNHPSIMVLVTHSGSSKNSDMKCWRNICELCEAKATLSPLPVVISIVFDSVMKPSLKKLQETIFDAQLIVGDKEYARRISDWFDSRIDNLPIDQYDKADEISKLLQVDSGLKEIYECLACDLKKSFESISKSKVTELWKQEKKRPKGNLPAVKISYLRRGLSKLAIFDSVEFAYAIYKGKINPTESIPEYLYRLGLIRAAIPVPKINDLEIKYVFDCFEYEYIKSTVDWLSSVKAVQVWVAQLRDSPFMEIMGNYIISHYNELVDSSYFYSAAIELHENPKALIDGEIREYPQNVWLLSYVIEIVKAYLGKANAYGVAQMANEVVSEGYGTVRDLQSANQFGGGFGFSAWMIREKSAFRDDLIRGTSSVLARRLKEIGKERVTDLIRDGIVEKFMVNGIINAKLCCYSQFKPIYALLERTIDIRQIHYRTCFAEKAGLTGNAGKTTVGQSKNTIINWQTGTPKGRDHKRKELSGRAVGLRYSWDTKAKKFVARKGVKKLILILDGLWSEKDLRILINAGWDEIFYPDEIDKLKEAIV